MALAQSLQLREQPHNYTHRLFKNDKSFVMDWAFPEKPEGIYIKSKALGEIS
jgi:hypothetical protein